MKAFIFWMGGVRSDQDEEKFFGIFILQHPYFSEGHSYFAPSLSPLLHFDLFPSLTRVEEYEYHCNKCMYVCLVTFSHSHILFGSMSNQIMWRKVERMRRKATDGRIGCDSRTAQQSARLMWALELLKRYRQKTDRQTKNMSVWMGVVCCVLCMYVCVFIAQHKPEINSACWTTLGSIG